jgi:hypothetical protein
MCSACGAAILFKESAEKRRLSSLITGTHYSSLLQTAKLYLLGYTSAVLSLFEARLIREKRWAVDYFIVAFVAGRRAVELHCMIANFFNDRLNLHVTFTCEKGGEQCLGCKEMLLKHPFLQGLPGKCLN